jgi:CheY-like chemotaxis protein
MTEPFYYVRLGRAGLGYVVGLQPKYSPTPACADDPYGSLLAGAADDETPIQTFRNIVSIPKNTKSVVAIVDDDPRVLESLEELLVSAGHAARTFSSAGALLNSKVLSEIDCLITDIGMPGMDGIELQRLMSERRPDLPVILITGRHELAELPQARHSRLFRKPFDGGVLLAAISDVLNRRENPQEA